jgi:hypothetical protein
LGGFFSAGTIAPSTILSYRALARGCAGFPSLPSEPVLLLCFFLGFCRQAHAGRLGSSAGRMATPNPAIDPVPFGHWTLRDKAAQRRSSTRWGAESMRHFASSHIQPFALSPMRLVLPVRKVSAVPSFPRTRRFAAASASCWRPLRGAPLDASAQVRASRGQPSACVVGRGAIASVGRPLLRGRLARATQIRRVPSSAHRGRRIASADSCATRVACDGRAFASRIRIAHSALAPAHVVPASPVNRSAPTHRSRGRCAMKPRSAPELKRWGAQVMRHFASSHIQPVAPSPACLVVPVRKVSALPSFPHTRRFAAACASLWRPLRGAPLEASAQVRASRGQASACVGGHGSVVSLGRPLLLGRLARVTQIRRVPSSAHRGRRIASADSCATRVACGGFAFASRIRIAHSAPAPAPVVPASLVNRSAPTHRSRGRCAMKPRSAPELKRWGAESMRHFASSHIQPFAPSPACLVVPVREVSAVPSLPHTRRFAAACASLWRPLRGAPLEASAQVRASRGQASACVGGHGSVVSLGRPLLLGRLARVTRIRRVPSSAHRGRRIASADSCATRVGCGGFAFASRIRIAHSALAPAPVVPASLVNRSAPTHRSRGRCAMKPRSAPELKRWGSPW